ncbi:MAG: hypothetical protein ACUVTZ_12935 [Armatimonadota bacterium]
MRVVTASVILAVTAALAGCSGVPRDVAVVNGEPLSYQTYCAVVQAWLPDRRDPVGEMVLLNMIRQRLIVQEAKRVGCYPTPEQVDAEMRNPSAQAYLLSGKLTEAQFRDVYVIPALAERNLVIRQAQLSLKGNWDRRVQEHFLRNRERFDLPERANILLVAVRNEKDLQEAVRMSQTQSPEAVVSAVMGPDSPLSRPTAVAKGAFPPELLPLEKAIFDTPPGRWTKPVRLERPAQAAQLAGATRFIAYILERMPAERADLSNLTVRQAVEMDLAHSVVPRDYIQELLERKLRDARIRVVPASLKSVELALASQSPVPHAH